MNIPYLLQTLKTNKLSVLVENMDMPPLDFNLAIWDAIDAGEIEVDEKKDRVKLLVEPVPSSDPELSSKIIRVIQHYAKEQINPNRGRINPLMKDPLTNNGYPWHEYFMALQHLIDSGQVIEQVVSVPGVKNQRPPHKFAFLCLPENLEQSEEWNAKQVNHFIATWKPNKVK